MCFFEKTPHAQDVFDRNGEDIELHCRRLREILKAMTGKAAHRANAPRILLSEIESLRGYALSRPALRQSLSQPKGPEGVALGVALVDCLLRWAKGEVSPAGDYNADLTRMPDQEARRLSGCVMFLLNIDLSFLGDTASS